MNDSATRLEKELLDEAHREAERIVRRAREQAAKALTAVRSEMETLREKRLAEARREADAQARVVGAAARLERRRRWLALREAGFETLFDRVLADLENGVGIDPDRSLRELLREALEAVGPGPVVVRLSPRSAGCLSEQAIADVQRQAFGPGAAGASFQRLVDAALRPGVVVESADGTRRFDNTYATRLERLREPLRALLARDLPAAESRDDDA